MPDYATQAEVQRHAGGERRLTEIADHDGNGVIDTGLVDLALDEAEALINSYARKQYEVPMNPVPPSIREMAAAMAAHNLKRYRDALTERDLVLHELRMDWLKGLGKGTIDPGISPAPATSGHVAAAATDRPKSKRVSRNNLKGFS